MLSKKRSNKTTKNKNTKRKTIKKNYRFNAAKIHPASILLWKCK